MLMLTPRALGFAICMTAATVVAQDRAFLDRLSADAGETVQVFVSTTSPTYKVSLLRSYDFGSSALVAESGDIAGTAQPTFPGSRCRVASTAALEIRDRITLEVWVYIHRRVKHVCGILSKCGREAEAAYSLCLDGSGKLILFLGATGAFEPEDRLTSNAAVPAGEWTHIVATYDGQTVVLYVNGEPDASKTRTGPIYDSKEPVRIGWGSDGATAGAFNGDLDSPAIYRRVLSQDEVRARYQERAHYGDGKPGVLAGCVAQWNLQELAGTVLKDATGNGNDATLINYATRQVAGPAEGGDPPSRSIRFSGNDLFNPDWSAGHAFRVDPAWESGFYLVTVRTESRALVLPFFIKPPQDKRARIAVLAATNTWHAYNGWAGSLYDRRADGTIVYYVGMRQPNPGAHADLHTPGKGYSHLVDAERYLWAWLRDNDYAFDIYTDLDLHRGPDLLKGYDVLILAGHSEYWSAEAIDHTEAFLGRGGSLVNLSGNTMWSRVTYDPAFTIMEGRKFPHNAGKIPDAERAHSQDGGVPGGTWRLIGRPEHKVLGTGYGIIFGGGKFGAYHVLEPDHWVFAGTGVEKGTAFGTKSRNGNAILGHEADVVHALWSPENTQVVARGSGFKASELDISKGYRQMHGRTEGCDMVYFDHPGGGGVFGAPTIAFGGSVVVDKVASRVLRNVLDRFLR